ncbi:hypothetical protein COCNU_16G003440 [Cocos nucifera]|uniref:Uncharacterized protein n=1 Tax=Cocos nucifera TaxID=13894 RepID=A0A8K0IYA9_COCNU|nr:hypothetical protein COCNU_16G003440 [Cocos nucifera]
MAALPPMPPLIPKDPFLSKLASAPEALAGPPSPDSDTPPFLDIFDSPKLMVTPAPVKERSIKTQRSEMVEHSVSYNEQAKKASSRLAISTSPWINCLYWHASGASCHRACDCRNALPAMDGSKATNVSLYQFNWNDT